MPYRLGVTPRNCRRMLTLEFMRRTTAMTTKKRKRLRALPAANAFAYTNRGWAGDGPAGQDFHLQNDQQRPVGSPRRWRAQNADGQLRPACARHQRRHRRPINVNALQPEGKCEYPSEPEIVVGFPKVKDISEEERLRRLKAEAERLANQRPRSNATSAWRRVRMYSACQPQP